MMRALIFGGRIKQDHQIKSQEKIYVSRCSSQPDADSLGEADATTLLVWRCRPFPIFRGRGKGLAHSHRRSRSGLHPI